MVGNGHHRAWHGGAELPRQPARMGRIRRPGAYAKVTDIHVACLALCQAIATAAKLEYRHKPLIQMTF